MKLAQTLIKRRKIFFASIIIVVLVISSIGAVIIYNQLTNTRISLSLSTNQTNILQGSSSQIQVNVESKGHPEKTTLTASLNSSAIQFSFSPATGKSSFNSTLTINVPDSIPTANYSLTVIASGDAAAANASCIISVLSENIKVSGEIQVGYPTSGVIDSLQFKDIRTMANYTVTIEAGGLSATTFEDGLYNEANYSIVLKNEETYNVTVHFTYEGFYNFNNINSYGLPTLTPFSVVGLIGNIAVYAPAGNSTITGLTLSINYNNDFQYACHANNQVKEK